MSGDEDLRQLPALHPADEVRPAAEPAGEEELPVRCREFPLLL